MVLIEVVGWRIHRVFCDVCDEGFQTLGKGFQGNRSMARTDESSRQAQLSERLHELASKALRVENPRPPVSAGGKIMQVVETVVVTLSRHAGHSITIGNKHLDGLYECQSGVGRLPSWRAFW